MTKYKKGRRFEYKIKSMFEEDGYYVTRSSGSHGIFDLIAIKKGNVVGIQCKATKRSNITRSEIEKVREFGRKYGIIPCIAYKEGRKAVVECLYNNKRWFDD